ncbi:MAG: TetR/AcrR family transcriptional regulator [Solirubrobacterales bacterium]
MSAATAAQPGGTGVASSDRGAERRSAILGATVRVLGSRGLGAVTHRAVAEEAGVPLAATTYYFCSKDELLVEALKLLAGEQMARLGQRADELDPEQFRSPERLAEAMTEILIPSTEGERESLLASYEVYLEAARRPALRATAAHWIGAFNELAANVLAKAGAADPERQAPLLVAALDGILIHQMATGEGPGEHEDERRRIERLIVALTR